jgi:integrase
LETNAYALTPATSRSSRPVLHPHVVPCCTDLPWGHVSDAPLTRRIASLHGLQGTGGRPLGPQRLTNDRGPLHTRRKEAAEHKVLPDDPTVFVKRRRVPKPEIDPVAPQESAPLVGHVTPHARAYVHGACLTGRRPNEPIALTGRHVDCIRRTIASREGRVRKDEGQPTTQASRRDIERLEPVDDLLLRPRGETWLRGEYGGLHQERRPIAITTLRRRIWYPALKRVGLRARTLNQTRPTCATLLLATSEHPEWIARQLGHTSTQMLFQCYAKFIPNLTRRDGAAFLGAYQRWFGSKDELGAAARSDDGQTRRGPLSELYDTFTPPYKKGVRRFA